MLTPLENMLNHRDRMVQDEPEPITLGNLQAELEHTLELAKELLETLEQIDLLKDKMVGIR